MIRRQERLAGVWRCSLRLRQPSLRLIIIALIVELVLPFIGASVFVTTRLADAERANDGSRQLGIARAFSSEIDRQLLNAEAALKALATSPESPDAIWRRFIARALPSPTNTVLG